MKPSPHIWVHGVLGKPYPKHRGLSYEDGTQTNFRVSIPVTSIEAS